MVTKIIPLSNFNIDETYLAHTPNETLIEHSSLTLQYFYKIVDAKNLENIIDSLIKKIDTQQFDLIKEMFVSAVYLHDIGKKNPYFQANTMHNNNAKFRQYINATNSTNHSILSADLYIKYYLDIIQNQDRPTREKLKFIIYSFSYHIAKHHGKLDEFGNYKSNEKHSQQYWSYLDNFKIPQFEFYILNKILFSLMVSSDYYATAEYMCKLKTTNFGLLAQENKVSLREKFNIYKSKFNEQEGINRLRNEIYFEAEKNLLDNISKNIFYLEAPTGSGKTITSINLALTLLEKNISLNKIFYIFPFNTLVEQTKNVFDNAFGDTLEAEVINSITPIKEQDDGAQESEESKYDKAYINRLFFHKPLIITTHVSFFNILFGTSKEDNFPLWQFANSVVILDEIQSYDNNLWWYMAEFFDKYADLLNIKMIIMSATLPKLDYFLDKKTNFIDLISIETKNIFFQSEYFKNRVQIEYFKLPNKITLNDLFEKFLAERKSYKKILFEFIKKQSARDFFNLLAEKGISDIYELSGDDNKAYRQFVINKSKENNPIIIVATQVIEAGIDIDMDLGFKDISILDSEEQFIGRLNRNCQKNHLNPKVYFFNFDDAEKIYKGDNRLGYDLKKDEFKKILEEKNFQSYYQIVLQDIKNDKEKFKNGLNKVIDGFTDSVKLLNYKNIKTYMSLINTQTFTLYFPFKIDISKYKNVKEFENLKHNNSELLANNILDGKKVWNKFLELNNISGFVKKEIEKSKINALMQFFTFNIFKYSQERPFLGEEINGYFYIENYQDFITKDGKFDRAKFNDIKNSKFL